MPVRVVVLTYRDRERKNTVEYEESNTETLREKKKKNPHSVHVNNGERNQLG